MWYQVVSKKVGTDIQPQIWILVPPHIQLCDRGAKSLLCIMGIIMPTPEVSPENPMS